MVNDKNESFQSPGNQVLIKNLLDAMDACGLNQTQLADRLGLHKTAVSRIFNGERKLTIAELGLVADVTGCSMNQLTGIEPRQAATTWQPSYEEPKALLEVWAAHQRRRNEIVAFDHNVVCSATTSVVHEKRDRRLFETLTWTKEGEQTLRKFGDFATIRRNRYLTTNETTAPKITSLMFRSDFEKLVKCECQYQDCTATEVWLCLGHLRECVDLRNFRLLLLDEAAVEKRNPNLLRYTASIDSLALIGGSLVVKRGTDFSISFFDKDIVVQEGTERLRELAKSAGHNPDSEVPKSQVLGLLDKYVEFARQRMATEIRAGRD